MLALLPLLLTAEPGARTVYRDHTQPFFRLYDDTHGLASPVIRGLAQGEDGRLWVLSDAGLFAFDGVRFEPIALPFSASAVLEHLHMDAAGRLWIAAYGSSEVVNGTPAEGWSTVAVEGQVVALSSVHEDGRVVAHIATSRGVFTSVGGAPATLELAASTRALQAAEGSLWLATSESLLRKERGRWTRVDCALGQERFYSVFPRLSGGVWIGTERGLYSFAGGSTQELRTEAERLQFVTGVAELASGEVWASTDLGQIWRCAKDAACKRLVQEKPPAVVSAALASPASADEEPVLWFGSDRGLVQALPRQWRRQTPGAAAFATAVHRFAEASDGTFVLAGEGAEAVIAQNGAVKRVAVGREGDRINALSGSADGVWAGSKAGRLWEVLGKGVKTQDEGDSIFAIAASKTPELLLARRYGPATFDPAVGRVEVASRASLPSWGRLFSALVTTGGQRFVGGEDGLFTWRDSAWHPLPLPVATQVLALAEENAPGLGAAIWVGTAGEGAFRLDLEGGGWRHFGVATSPALANGFIDAVVVDEEKRVVLCTEKGVSVLHAGDTGAALRHFTRGNGLPSESCVHGGMYRDSEGRVWVATSAGVAVLDGQRGETHERPWPLAFRSIAVAGRTVRDERWRELDEAHARLRFSYSMPAFVRGEDVRYRTQLIGLEAEPGAWTAETWRDFPTLAAGQYTLQVWAKDHAGRRFGPVSEAFLVRPPWWRSWTALLAGLLLTALVAFSMGSLRSAQLRRRTRVLERMVSERTAELRAQKDALEASYRQADRIFGALREALKGSLLDGVYRLESEIGKGGYGAVFRALDLRSSRAVAVKVFRPAPGNDSPEALERFKREIETTKQLHHPNAVAVLDGAVSSDGVAYMVMELLQGQSLRQRMEVSRMGLAQAIDVAVPILGVLAYAHARGVVHRDIKPDNVFLHQTESGDQVVKLLDFGVAMRTDATLGPTLTMTGAVVGTPRYMAPERLDYQRSDGRADVYSVAVMVYEMLSGELPFSVSTDNLLALALAHLNEAPIPLSTRDSSAPRELSELLSRCLEKDPELRPTAAEAADALSRLR